MARATRAERIHERRVAAGRKVKAQLGPGHYQRMQAKGTVAAAAARTAKANATPASERLQKAPCTLRALQLQQLTEIATLLDLPVTVLLREAVDLWLSQHYNIKP